MLVQIVYHSSWQNFHNCSILPEIPACTAFFLLNQIFSLHFRSRLWLGRSKIWTDFLRSHHLWIGFDVSNHSFVKSSSPDQNTVIELRTRHLRSNVYVLSMRSIVPVPAAVKHLQIIIIDTAIFIGWWQILLSKCQIYHLRLPQKYLFFCFIRPYSARIFLAC